MMKGVIMAGGRGTRLQSVASDIPKPMVPVLGKPVLEYQLESLKAGKITDIILIVGHLGQVIQDYFGNGQRWGVNISYIVEQEPLGTAGALYYLKEVLNDDFFLIFGDLMLDIDWNRFMSFHKQKNSRITLYGHPNGHPYDSDIIITDLEGKVTAIDPKGCVRSHFYHNFTNAGLYCVSPLILHEFTKPEKKDLEKEIIAKLIPQEKVYAYRGTEYVKDMGTPDRYERVLSDVKKGIVFSKSLKNKQKCIFLDRDGTLNKLKGFLNRAKDLELLPGTEKAVRMINESGYLAVAATNQPVVARGECTLEELEQIHMKLETELGKEGAYLVGIYFCPHHPHKGFEGEVAELKIDCNCRKPKTGMIIQAAEEYNIDLSDSWYIGDTTVDIQTGINAGMGTVLLMTGEAGKDGKYKGKPDYIAEDLLGAVAYILNKTK